ncbi:glycosyltransferase family 39 protein [Candidatus Saccharibacteria bacterium]|nr:glycosyltransferase family 39 protein [Candidatus Saccharibacteria bacterium]
MKLKKPSNRRHWLYIALGVGALSIIYIFLFRGLYGLTGGLYSTSEVLSQQQGNALKTIFSNPINAPYEILVWLGLKLGHHSILVTRVAAVLCAVPLVGLFYLVARHWYSPSIAALGSVMFATSSSYLHFARFGTAMILQMATLALLASVFLYRKAPGRQKVLVAYVITALCASLIYVPGIIWFGLIGIALLWRRFRATLTSFGALHSILVPIFGLLLLSPLIYGCFNDSTTLRSIFGLPSDLPTPLAYFKELLHLVASVAYRGYWPSEYWMYGAPLLNVAEALLFVAGLWLMFRRPMIQGNYYLLFAILVGGLLVALRGSVTVALLVPFIYLIIAGGLHLLYEEWRQVFPRNPFANVLGGALIVLVASFSIFYHLRAYYTAWPNTPETKAAYTIRQPL